MTQDSLQNHDPLFSFCFVVVFFFFFLSRGIVHTYVQDYSEKKEELKSTSSSVKSRREGKVEK